MFDCYFVLFKTLRLQTDNYTRHICPYLTAFIDINRVVLSPKSEDICFKTSFLCIFQLNIQDFLTKTFL